MARRSVFYSWQSDLPNNTNRSFIEDSLRRASQAITRDDSIDVEPVIDRDTVGESGSPDIAASIFGKIARAEVFVADVSVVTPAAAPRPSPNPNVLIELGFAISTLTWDRIVMVMNTAFGDVKELPFDLRNRRVVRYSFQEMPGSEKGDERRQLTRQLEQALRLIFQQPALGQDGRGLGDIAAHLSEDAKVLLVAASRDATHYVAEMDSNAGLLVMVGAHNFVEDGNGRSEARWRAAVRELLGSGLIERERPGDQVLMVTDRGFRAADLLWRAKPRLSLMAEKVRQEPTEFIVKIVNDTGCAAAVAPLLSLVLPTGITKTLYGLDGNGRDGLPMAPRVGNMLTFRGKAEDVLDGGAALPVTKITKERSAPDGSAVHYELAAQNYDLTSGDLGLDL